MKWYRININFLSKDYENIAREISSPAGKDKESAIKSYYAEIAKGEKCFDDKTRPARIDLTEYIYSKKLNRTRTEILLKNY